MTITADTEIVAYADDMPTFNEAYPLWKDGYISGNGGHYKDIDNTVYHSWELRITDSYLSSDSSMYNLASNNGRIYALCLRQYGTTTYSVEEVLSTIGVCYYIISQYAETDITNEQYYMRLTSSDIPADINNPFDSPSLADVNGEDIYWLYNLGQFLFSSSSEVANLLNINIGGYNLLTLMFGAGFILYAGWCVIKWVIP